MAQASTAPVIVVETVHPGGNAAAVAETVAAPVEQMIQRLDGVARLLSRSGEDGTYSLFVIFRPGIDLDRAKSAVQNRLALAQPTLPEAVNRAGVTVAAKQPIRAVINLTSPGGKQDLALMSGLANQLRNELARIPGVGAIRVLGSVETRVRIWLDPDRLEARALSVSDIVSALEKRAATPPKSSDTIENLTDGLEQVVVRTDDAGNVVRLSDIARVELGVQSHERATLNSQACVAFTIAGDGNGLTQRIAERATQLGATLPKELALSALWDLSGGPEAGDFALIDVALPESASAERGQDALGRCDRLLHQVEGVADVLSLSANPFDLDPRQACILVRLAAKSEALRNRQLIRQLRARLGDDAGMVLRLRDGWSPLGVAEFAYPLDLAISGPELGEARELADQFVHRLRKSTKLNDIAVNRDSVPQTRLEVEIDRTKARLLGLKSQEIADTVALYTGSLAVGTVGRAGPRIDIAAPAEGKVRGPLDAIKRVRLRNAQGELVPLGTVAAVRSIAMPTAVYRLDAKPMVRVTANLTDGGTPEVMRAFCERALDELLKEPGRPTGYRLTWLGEPAKK
jgi:multidrug efflux pump subunit AcrB